MRRNPAPIRIRVVSGVVSGVVVLALLLAACGQPPGSRVTRVTIRIVDEAGRPLPDTNVELGGVTGAFGVWTSSFVTADGEGRAEVPRGGTITVARRGFRIRRLQAPGAGADVVLRPGILCTVTLPEDLDLPADSVGLGVRIGSDDAAVRRELEDAAGYAERENTDRDPGAVQPVFRFDPGARRLALRLPRPGSVELEVVVLAAPARGAGGGLETTWTWPVGAAHRFEVREEAEAEQVLPLPVDPEALRKAADRVR